jgi:hypothetical protein
MDDQLCRQYFLAPQETSQRRYEALRAVFVDGEPLAIVAQRFGYKVATLKSMACRFRADCRRGVSPPFFFRTVAADRPDPVATTGTNPNPPKSPTAGS